MSKKGPRQCGGGPFLFGTGLSGNSLQKQQREQYLMAEIWSITVIVGPIILIAAIIYAWLRNRNARKATKRKADRGAERLQEKVERDQTPV